jgi:hypothetical protein
MKVRDEIRLRMTDSEVLLSRRDPKKSIDLNL